MLVSLCVIKTALDLVVFGARMLVHTMLANSGFALSMTGWHLRETGILGIGLVASMIMCFVLIRGHGQIGAALAGFVVLSMINVTRYAVVRSMFGIRHIKIAAAEPIALAVITAALTYLLLQPIDHRTLVSTVFAVFVFSALFAGSACFLLTTDHDPRIEGNCE